MMFPRLLPAAGIVGLLGVVALGFAGCGQDGEMPLGPQGGIDVHGADLASQARLWLSVQNAENVYIGSSTDPWLTESWYTEAQSFDIVLTNTSDFAIDEVYLLVTIPLAFQNIPGWTVQVGDLLLGPTDFAAASTDIYGFDGGSHGVYPPSGTGIFFPYPIPGILAAHASVTIPVIATRGAADGFRLHFDAGSTRLWTPPSHDVTVLPPVGIVATGACCTPDGCQEIPPAACEAFGAYYGGDGSTCDPDPCTGSGE